MKKSILLIVCLNMFFTSVVLSNSKKLCSDVLESFGYNLTAYAFKKRGLISREKHIFNGSLICYIDSGGNIRSIEDNDVLIAKDGFYGQEALAERDRLNNEREQAINYAKKEINEEYDIKIEALKMKYTPENISANLISNKEKIQREEETARLRRKSEIDKIKLQTGSNVSLSITGEKEQACADLLAGTIEDIDIHQVVSESIWGGKYTVWYRNRDSEYLEGQYHTRKCQVTTNSVSILGIFDDWD